MIRILPLFVIVVLLYGCRRDNNIYHSDNNSQYYIIRPPDSNMIKRDQNNRDTIMIMREYYAPYNIIFIDSLDKTYYHKSRFFCFTGYPENNILPFFVFLKKDNFRMCSSIHEMEQIILNDSSINRKWVYLISNKDTITDLRYFRIKKRLIESNFNVSTRLLTEEEELIMNSILNNGDYNPEKVKWEKTLMIPDKELLREIYNNDVH